MGERLDELHPDTAVVLVTFTSRKLLDGYQAERSLPFPTLIDRDRSGYRAFGLDRGSVWRVWGWQAGRRYLELLRRDGLRGLRRPVEDSLQLGGDFVIAPDGTLAWGFWGEGPDDRPSVDALIAAVDDL